MANTRHLYVHVNLGKMFDDETVMFKIYFEPFLQKSLFIFNSWIARMRKSEL